MEFTVTAITVAMMMLYAVPGFILVKTRSVKPESISAFAKVLLFVCQPCLFIYAFSNATFTVSLLREMGIFFGICTALQIAMLFIMYAVFHKKYDDVRNRVCTVACTLGNVSFLGIPLLEAVLPAYPQAIIFSSLFSVSMNLLAWTLVSALLTADKKYMNVKKFFLNPPVLSLLIALPLFFTCTKLPSELSGAVALVGRMSTPMCMLVLGMRLATVHPKAMFSDRRVYISCFIKQVLYPLFAMAAIYFVPVPYYVKATLFILCACPSASLVLNLSEIYGAGQKSAANTVLTSTIFSMITLPLMLLIL